MISLLILAHLSAVVAPPLAFQARGPRGLSPSVATLLRPMAAYGQFLYLDRGYAFFARDPGPSHLVDVEQVMAGSSERKTLERFPDLSRHRPRLLYHRHFMLAEFLHDAYQPKLPDDTAELLGPQLTPEELQAFRLTRKRYEAIESSMLRHLQAKWNSPDVRLTRIEHSIADFVLVANGNAQLDDSNSYYRLEDVRVTLEDLVGTTATLPTPDASPERVQSESSTAASNQSVAREPVPAPQGEKIDEKIETGIDRYLEPEQDAVPDEQPTADSTSQSGEALP